MEAPKREQVLTCLGCLLFYPALMGIIWLWTLIWPPPPAKPLPPLEEIGYLGDYESFNGSSLEIEFTNAKERLAIGDFGNGQVFGNWRVSDGIILVQFPDEELIQLEIRDSEVYIDGIDEYANARALCELGTENCFYRFFIDIPEPDDDRR